MKKRSSNILDHILLLRNSHREGLLRYAALLYQLDGEIKETVDETEDATERKIPWTLIINILLFKKKLTEMVHV